MSSMNLAYRSLTRRKTRAILSISGIMVGVTMILVLLSLASGTSTSSTNLLRAAVTAQITVTNSTTPTLGGFGRGSGGGGGQFFGGSPPSGGGTFFRNFSSNGGGGFAAFFGGGSTIPESYVNTIADLTGVYAVSPQLSASGYVDNESVLLYGVNPSSFSQATTGLDISNGSMLTSADQVVLNDVFATNLGVTVGGTVAISNNSLSSTNSGTNFTVAGIYSAGSTFGPASRSAYLELSSAQSITNKTSLVTEIDVKATNPNLVHNIVSEIESSLSGVTASTGSSVASEASLSASLAIFFIVIGGVALLAGGFGVTNTMIMSINERTREIGTLRAIGAHKTQVLRIFFSESLLIGLLGAAAGAFFGIVISLILPYFSSSVSSSGLFGGLLGGRLATSLVASNILLSIGLGVIVGVLAGIYPALRASRMNPEEAIRYAQ
jgi:ABC-type lipoprotein release transport system permease subunit